MAKRGLKGNVAELGVYKGKFARYLNHFFQIENYIFLTLLKDLIKGIQPGKDQRIILQACKIFLTLQLPQF
jgi:hypothetical protein